MRIFRDETNLAASPQLWQSIVDELAQARWFLLLASPEAASSKWVAREVQWWLEQRSPDRLLILLTAGELAWDEGLAAPDFDWSRTTALPRSLAGVFAQEPHFIDVRGLTAAHALTLQHAAFRAAVLKVAAPLHGRSPDEMDGEAVRVLRRNRRWAGAAFASLAALTAVAMWQTRVAIEARDIALSRQLAAQSVSALDRSADTAMLLAVQAWRTQPTPEARSALLRCLQQGPILRFLPGQDSPVVGVAIEREARWVVAASASGQVARLPADGSAPDWTYRSPVPIERLAMTPDGSLVAIGRRDGLIELLRPGRPTPVRTLQGPHARRITAMAFAPDGTRLVSGSDDQGLTLWDAATGGVLNVVPEQHNRGAIDALAFGDEGRQVYVAMGLAVTVWDGATLQRQGQLGDGKASPLIDALAFLPGTSTLIGAGWDDGRWYLWRWRTTTPGTEPSASERARGGIVSLAVSADASVLALGDADGQVAFSAYGAESSYKAHTGEVSAVAVSADGRHVVSGGKDGRIVLWDRQSRPLPSGRMDARSIGWAPLVASADGRWLVSGNRDGELIWISSGSEAPTLRIGPAVASVGEPRGQTRGVTALAFAPDDRRLAVGMADGSLVLQRVDGSASTQPVQDWGPGYPVLGLAFSPDGGLLVSGHADGSVVLRNAADATPRGEPANIVNDSGDGIVGLSFSDDGQRLLVQTRGRGVVVRAVASLAIASRATRESALAHTAPRVPGAVFSAVARSPVDSWWAWGSTEGEVHVRASDETPAIGTALVVEGGMNIRAMAFSRDGITLAAGGVEPQGLLLWDLREGRPVDEPLRGVRTTGSIAFTADGRFLLTRSAADELEWWSTDAEAWARAVCALVNRRFTPREWARYMGGLPISESACP